ncbi:hypothetical protein ABT174_03930 [Streptomyces sparsogenes]|uniref:hypothetical protein n=1 Tax=Streptomyces sparsogenes TaxID=67365 RepID=UPI003316D2A2
MNAPTAPTAAPARHRHHPHLRVPRPHVRARPHPSASWVVPVALGVLYGGWAMFITHNQGTSVGWAGLLGVVAALVAGTLCYLIGKFGPALMPELRAAACGALLGCAFGFLYSLSGHAVFRSSIMGLAGGLGMYAASFYVFHTHTEDRGDRGNRGDRGPEGRRGV